MALPVRKSDRLKSEAHRRAPKQEKQLAVRLGGRTTKQSGAGDDKGDVRIKGVMKVEAKCTIHNSFSITRAMLEKIEDQAVSCGEVPAVHVEFIDRDTGAVLYDCAVVPSWVLKGYVNDPA